MSSEKTNIQDTHPTPWRIEVAPKGWGDHIVIFDRNGKAVMYKLYPDEAIYQRIVACVNACKGLKEPDLDVEALIVMQKSHANLTADHIILKQRFEVMIEALLSAKSSLEKLGYNNPQVNKAISGSKTPPLNQILRFKDKT